MDKKIRLFKSLEEMNEAHAKEMAAIPGEKHLENVVAHIKKIYAKELEIPFDKTIKWKKKFN